MPDIHVIWGEAPEDGALPSTYSFDTQAEVDAFLLALNEYDGWLGYQCLEHPRHTVRDGEIIDLDNPPEEEDDAD